MPRHPSPQPDQRKQLIWVKIGSAIDPIRHKSCMTLDQMKSFLLKMQNDASLKQSVLAASTADDVAKIGNSIGFEFSGDELLRFSGKKVGRVTVSKQETPGEYN
jgi:predicted ribosomally synthesized peptide with nif11-like leader